MGFLNKTCPSNTGCLIYKSWLDSCAAQWFVSIFHSFKAGIANAISSFKWWKIIFFLNKHIPNWTVLIIDHLPQNILPSKKKNICITFIQRRPNVFGVLISETFYLVWNQLQPVLQQKMKWIDLRPPLCTYRLNWARRTSWGWWDVTALQTQDSKCKSWMFEVEHATSRSRRLPKILSFTNGWRRNIFVSFKLARPGNEPRALAFKTAVLTTTLGPRPL